MFFVFLKIKNVNSKLQAENIIALKWQTAINGHGLEGMAAVI